MKNKYNLPRTIPSEVKREVRRRCGFGCVVCGSAIYDYEHFNPEFNEAKKHNPDGIALLCPTDHARKRKKLLSREKYLNAISNPKALEQRKAYAEWEVSNFAPTIVIGQKIFTGGTSILSIDGELLLGFDEPEKDGAPPRLNFRFFDKNQNEVFSIIENEISVFSDAFDIETTTNIWTVRSKLYKVDLIIELNPPNSIVIKQLHFHYKKWELLAKDEKFELKYDGDANLMLSGPVIVHGPCRFNLKGEGGVEMKDMHLQGLGGLEEKSNKPIMFKWPLFFYVDAEDDTPFEEVELLVIRNYNLFPIFTSEEEAKQLGSELIPSRFKLRSLGSKGFTRMLEIVAIPRGTTKGILNPNLSSSHYMFSPIDLIKFVEDNSRVIHRNDPCPCESGLRYKECHGKL